MTPPQRYHKDKSNHNSPQQQSPSSQPHQMVPFLPQTPTSLPTTPIPLYPTGAAAIVPAPPTYELIPNRIFVGGFPTSTTESELREHFEKFFPVKDVKMVKSLDGQSKGYGFITFETEDQAEEIRQLNPKQLEFRSRKLNLGPAIRKINASAFPPGYAIATPSQLVSASPGPFGYAIPASPGPYGGFSFSAAPQMFVYPPVPNQDQNRQSPEQQQTTPQLSPTGLQQQQSPQVFFGGDQEPVRTYASAVAGTEKLDSSSEDRRSSSPQPLVSNQNMLNTPYSGQQQWTGNDQHQQKQQMDSNNGGSYYNENYSHGYVHPQAYHPFAQTGMYMNSQGMFQPSYSYMTPPLPGGQYPQMMHPPYWPQQQQYQKHAYAGYGAYNNWIGPAGDMHNSQSPSNYGYQGYQGHPPQQHGGGNDKHSLPRPLQAPRAGKKSRKPSESKN